MKSYFEGWYFKIVDKSEEHTYAIIPGISFDKEGNAQSFIQFFDGKKVSMSFLSFNKSEFQYSRNRFNVKIGNNFFSSEGFELDFKIENLEVKGKINFSEIKSWPVKIFSPGAMDWYRFVPRMECYHGVLSFDHELEGKLTINGKEINFTEGRGYIEKDYGRSFPSYYLWGQTNHFDEPGISLMFSFAKIPWLRSYFDGFIVGFMYNNKLYRFATYTGAKITKLKLEKSRIIIYVRDKNHRLEIEATRSIGVLLPSPIEGSMTGRILESMTAKISVKFIKLNKKKEKILFEGLGRNAGLDIGGRVEEIKEVN